MYQFHFTVHQLPDVIQDRLRHGVNTMGAFNKATVLLFSIHDFDEMINFWTPQKVQFNQIKDKI